MCRRELSDEHESPSALSTIDLRAGTHSGCQAVVRQKERSTTCPCFQAVEVLVVVGVLLWLVNRFIPMQSSIKSILNGVVVIAVVLWLLNGFGLFHSVSRMRIGS